MQSGQVQDAQVEALSYSPALRSDAHTCAIVNSTYIYDCTDMTRLYVVRPSLTPICQ